MRRQKTTILLDCSTIIYAAFYAMGHLSYNGQPTGIIYGFLSRLLQLAQKFNTTDFFFCFDSGSTWRTSAYPEYKQDRIKKRKEYTPDEQAGYDSLVNQSVLLNTVILPRMGFRNNFMQEQYEADDLLGYWYNKLSKHHSNIIMVTTDADMFQCLGKCKIWNPSTKKIFAQKDMIKKFGTAPEKWAMAKAIGGCSGDNVIGITGVSDPKSPKSYVHKYLAGKLNKGKVYDRIESKAGQKIIARNLPLVTVPYKEDLMNRMIRRRNNRLTRKSFLDEFDRWQFMSFLKQKNFNKWERAFKL